MATYTTWTYWTSPADSAWYVWNTTGTTSTTITLSTASTWAAWNTLTTWEPREWTAEELAAQEERDRRWREADNQRRQERAEADRKAQKLLGSCLTKRQRKTLREQSYFDVRSIRSDGQATVYRIHRGSQGNVYEVDADGRQVRRFCIHPIDVPAADAMLAQKLLLETDPAAFERIANITRLRQAA